MWGSRWSHCFNIYPTATTNNNKTHLFFFNPTRNPQHHQHLLPIQQLPNEKDAISANNLNQLHPPSKSLKMMCDSWLGGSKNRYLILVLCCPLILPLFCVTLPFLCVLEVFFRLSRRRELRRKRVEESCGGDSNRGGTEGSGNEGSLLQRYLEDQLILVAGSVNQCGIVVEENEDTTGVDVEYFDCRGPSLQ